MSSRQAKIPEKARASAPEKARQPASTLGVESHRDERTATTLARDAFSREKYEFLLRTLFVLLGLLAVSLAVVVFLGVRETKMRYFAVDPEGGIREVMPLNRPLQSTSFVLNWGTEAVVKSLTLSFANYQQQLNENRLSFTDSGWRSFQDAMKRSKVLDTITAQQLVSTVVPSAAPVISRQGVIDGGGYGWVVEIPVIITYESASQKMSNNQFVTATIVRRDESENPSGLGIAQFVVR